MTRPIQILIRDVWLRVGTRRWGGTFTVNQFSGPIGSAEILLLFRWSSRLSYLTLDVRQAPGDPASGRSGRPGEPGFAAGEAAEKTFKEHGGKITPDFAGKLLRCAVVDRDAKIVFELTVDTDDPKFHQDAGASAEEAVVHSVEYLALGLAGAEASPGGRYQVGKIAVVLTPSRRMQVDDGFMAIDLGNTSTMAVRVDPGRTRARDVEVIEPEVDGRLAETAPSAVRLLSFEPSVNPRWFEKSEFVYGARALDPSRAGDGWLVLGAKRLLTGPEHAAPERVWLGGRRVAVERPVPAELLLSGLFRSVHHAKARVPRRIAVTCPTTFSHREIQRLKHAVVQGWRRSLGATIREFDPASLSDPEIPQLVLDEAAAAAFYFLYRDFIDAPGGLYSFRYLYPQGLNLLVYDCGGGTTDVALLHARVGSNDGDPGDPSPDNGPIGRLTIRVLGRTGQRSFGGDYISAAAFRILKAKLACLINKRGLDDWRPPESEEIAAFLERYRAEIDFNVPTTYAHENLALDEQRLRESAAFELWSLAERFKIELGSSDVASGCDPTAMPALSRLIALHHGLEPGQIETHLGTLTLKRVELDALISEALDSVIVLANRMIRARLPEGEEVHRVHLVGNASRYPAVAESLRRRLRVSFLDQTLRVEDSASKSAVAKGAALALSVRAAFVGAEVDLDGGHVDRLPYDVTCEDLTFGGSRVLFHENQRFDELTPWTIPLPASRHAPSEDRARRVVLGRRWPGEDQAGPFLIFDFPRPIQGPLVVWYDSERHGFQMRDGDDPLSEVSGVEIYAASHRAPIESGEL